MTNSTPSRLAGCRAGTSSRPAAWEMLLECSTLLLHMLEYPAGCHHELRPVSLRPLSLVAATISHDVGMLGTSGVAGADAARAYQLLVWHRLA